MSILKKSINKLFLSLDAYPHWGVRSQQSPTSLSFLFQCSLNPQSFPNPRNRILKFTSNLNTWYVKINWLPMFRNFNITKKEFILLSFEIMKPWDMLLIVRVFLYIIQSTCVFQWPVLEGMDRMQSIQVMSIILMPKVPVLFERILKWTQGFFKLEFN